MTEKNLGEQDFIAISAMRYALGRMTYIVGDTVSWLIHQWPTLDEHARAIIKRDVDEAFEHDDRSREMQPHGFLYLGHDCDRREWERLRAMWRDNGDES